MPKRFHLPASAIRPFAEGLGRCVASDMITVGGARVGYMYRDHPEDGDDSGWSFFSGTEPEGYEENPGNFEIYDVNTIANYDPEIIPLLSAPPGSAYAREGPGHTLISVAPPTP